MVRECVVPECGTHARFNHPGETHGVYCSKHKEEGMRNVVHKPCIEQSCTTLAVFNEPGAGHGLYCGQHKPPGFVNVKDRKCNFEGCMRMPNFNFAGEKGGLYCSQHKQEGMIDIKHKRCMFPECTKRPSFNYTGEMRALYCGSHKQDGMVNVDQERRSCNRAKFAEIGIPNGKRQRTAGYSAKAAGYSLKQASLAVGEPVDASGEEVAQLAQPFDCGGGAVHPAVSEALAAGGYAAAIAGSDASMLLPSLPGADNGGLHGEGQAVFHAAAGAKPGALASSSIPSLAAAVLAGDAQLQQQQQAQQQVLQPHGAAQSAALPFLLLPQWQRPDERAALGLVEQQAVQAAAGAGAAPPHLPSPALLRNLCAADAAATPAAGTEEAAVAHNQAVRALAHLMHSHLVEFLRDYLRRPKLQGAKEDKARVCAYIDAFTVWEPPVRVEQYTLLHFDWDVAAAGPDKWAAVAARIDKALGAAAL